MLVALPVLAQDWKPVGDWKPTAFARAGKAHVDGKTIRLEPGAPMTGVTATGFEPRMNYEIRFEATRIRGNDFFASITFPYRESHATWVNGGWGGDIVGISSIDGWDASENETRTYVNFENERSYKFRLRVTLDRIEAWIDDKPVVNLAVNGRAISLRRGMDPTVPLSVFCYNTEAVIRNVEYREIATR